MSDSQSGGFKNILNAFQSGVDKVQVSLQKSGNSTFYPTTLSVQHSQKTGWLRKQGGVVKTWKKRWFTLKGDQLYYYLTEDESKTPQGVIPLAGNNVVELPLNPSKGDEFIFEIVPGGDKTKMSITHDTYPICAATEEERKAWVLVIRRIMFSQIGGAIFGQNLGETLLIEHRHRKKRKAAIQKKVPEIVESCVDFLMCHGLEVEGIFRLPGRTSLIRELKEAFDMGKRPQLDITHHDVQTIASLLKLYLRELPEPIIPCISYEPVMKIVNRDFHEDPDKAVANLAEEMTILPRPNYNLLQYICKFLYEIAQHSDVNKMTVMNLATVFVHAVIRPEDEDPALLMATASGRTQTVFLLITKHQEILKVEYTAQGDAVVTDNILEVDDLLETQKPFNASDLAGYSVLDSASGKTMSEEILDLTNDVGNGNSNLPQPLSPISNTDPHNMRGTRTGRFFKNYLDKDSVGSGLDEEEEGDLEDDYAVIQDMAQQPTRPAGREQGACNGQGQGQSTDQVDGAGWNYARNRQCISTYIEERSGDDDGPYSYLPEEKMDKSGKNLCESVSSIEEDYTTLTDYTSDYSALLRRKSSQMYMDTGQGMGDNREIETCSNRAQGARASVSSDDSKSLLDTERKYGSASSLHHKERSASPIQQNEEGTRPSPSPPPQQPGDPSFSPTPPPRKTTEKTSDKDVDELYRKIVKTNAMKKPSPKKANDDPDTDYDNVLAPPIPPKRPIANPRHSLSRSMIIENTEARVVTLTHSSSIDSGFQCSSDSSQTEPKTRFEGSSQSDYQTMNDILSVDLKSASREHLLAHIEVLQDQLFTTRDKHKKALQKFAEKLSNERTATQEAVTKVMALQSEIQQYQLKYGPLKD